MLANELISQIIMPLHTSDTGEEALNMMHVYHVRHLPIVNESALLGVISEEDILVQPLGEAIGSYRLSMVNPVCHEHDHLFEIMSRLGKYQLTVIPVLGEDDTYLGLITLDAVVHHFATQYAFTEPGSILVLESSSTNFSLSEVARIAESEDISILASFVHSVPDSTRLFVTLKLNRQSLAGFRSTLERFGYTVSATFAESTYPEYLRERYDGLMSYLGV